MIVGFLMQGQEHFSDDFAGCGGGDAAGVVGGAEFGYVAADDPGFGADKGGGFSEFFEGDAAWLRCSGSWEYGRIQNVEIQGEIDWFSG